MADYRGKVCKACGQVFKDGDDVVVCPVCGTPHHRQCWTQTGKCVNEEMHKDGYVWNEDKTASDTAGEHSSMITCKFCGKENRADALFCSHCGKALFDFQNTTENRTQTNGEPYGGAGNRPGGVWPPFYTVSYEQSFGDEKIEGVKASEIAVYVRENAFYYIRKFKQICNEGKKVTTNWAACFFSFMWWFSRKNYLMGTITALINMVFSFLLMPSMNEYFSLYEKMDAARQAGTQIAQGDMEALLVVLLQMAIIGFVSLAINFVISLFANKIYLNKVISDIKKINEKNLDEDEYRYMMNKKGGLSLLTGLAGYFGLYLLETLLMVLIDYVKM